MRHRTTRTLSPVLAISLVFILNLIGTISAQAQPACSGLTGDLTLSTTTATVQLYDPVATPIQHYPIDIHIVYDPDMNGGAITDHSIELMLPSGMSIVGSNIALGELIQQPDPNIPSFDLGDINTGILNPGDVIDVEIWLVGCPPNQTGSSNYEIGYTLFDDLNVAQCAGQTGAIQFMGHVLTVFNVQNATVSTPNEIFYRKVTLKNVGGTAIDATDDPFYADDRRSTSPGKMRLARLVSDLGITSSLDISAVDLDVDPDLEVVHMFDPVALSFLSSLPGWNSFIGGGGTLEFYEEVEMLVCPHGGGNKVSDIYVGWGPQPYMSPAGSTNLGMCNAQKRTVDITPGGSANMGVNWGLTQPQERTYCYSPAIEQIYIKINNSGTAPALMERLEFQCVGGASNGYSRLQFPLTISIKPAGNSTYTHLFTYNSQLDFIQANCAEISIDGPMASDAICTDDDLLLTKGNITKTPCTGGTPFLPDLGVGDTLLIEHSLRTCRPNDEVPNSGYMSFVNWIPYYKKNCGGATISNAYRVGHQRLLTPAPMLFTAGPFGNVISPEFVVPQDPGHLMRFELTNAPGLWYGSPGNDQLVIRVKLEPGLYISMEDVDRFSVTLPNLGNLVLTHANNDLELLECSPVHCSNSMGQGGWISDQEVLIKLDHPVLNAALLDQALITGPLVISRMTVLNSMRIDLHVRNHCPDNTGFYHTLNDTTGEYYFPCSPGSNAAPPAVAQVIVSLHHITDTRTGSPSDCMQDICSLIDGTDPQAGSSLLIAAQSKQLALQCPGCIKWGIHSDRYRIRRTNFGIFDVADDGVENGGVPMDVEQVWAQQDDPAANPLDGIRSWVAMVGDTVEGRLTTHIVNDCNDPSLGQYGPCFGIPGSQVGPAFTYAYYENTFYAPGAVDPVAAASLTANSGLLEPLTSHLIMTDGPGGPVLFDVEIAMIEGTTFREVYATTGQVTVRMDLSKSYLTLLPAGVVSFNEGGWNDYGFPHDGHLSLRNRYKVEYNAANQLLPVDVNNHIYFGVNPDASIPPVFPNNPALNGNFTLVEEAPCSDGVDMFCCEDGTTCSDANCVNCDQIKYYCTNQSGFFQLVGFTLFKYGQGNGDMNPAPTAYTAPCGQLVQYGYRLEVGPITAQGRTDIFTQELRNWYLLDDFEFSVPPGWDISRINIAQTLDRCCASNTTYYTLQAADITDLGGGMYRFNASDVAYVSTPFSTPIGGKLRTPDDDYWVTVDCYLAPGCEVLSDYDPNTPVLNRHPVPGEMMFDPSPGLIGEPEYDPIMHAAVLYHRQPSLSINTDVQNDIFGTDNWLDVRIEVAVDGGTLMRAPGIWCGFDRSLTFSPDGGTTYFLNVFEIKDKNGVTIALDNGPSGLAPGVYPFSSSPTCPGASPACAVTTSTLSYNFQIRVGFPCDEAALDMLTNGQDRIRLLAGWGCSPPATLPSIVDGSCMTEGILTVDPQALLRSYVLTTEVTEACIGVTAQLEVKNLLEAPAQDIDITLPAAADWNYVPNSLQIIYQHTADSPPGTPVLTTLQAGVDFTDIDPVIRRLVLNDPVAMGYTGGEPVFLSILSDGLVGSNNILIPPDQTDAHIIRFRYQVIPLCPVVQGTRSLSMVVNTNELTCASVAETKSVSVDLVPFGYPTVILASTAPDIPSCTTTTPTAVQISIDPQGLATSGTDVLEVFIPEEVSYELGSSFMCGVPIGDPTSTPSTTPAGNTLSYAVPSVAVGAPCLLTFDIIPALNCTEGDITMLATFFQHPDCPVLNCGSPGEWNDQVVINIGGSPPCGTTPTISTTTSYCGGPYLVDCGAFNVPVQPGNAPFAAITLNGVRYSADNGMPFIHFDQGSTTLTGIITNLTDATDKWWMQLYLFDTQTGTDWIGNGGAHYEYVNCGTPNDGLSWDYLAMEANNPLYSNMFIGLDANAGEHMFIQPSAQFRFQEGFETTRCSEHGIWGEFQYDLNGTLLPAEVHMALACEIDLVDEYSECDGSVSVDDLGFVAASSDQVEINLIMNNAVVQTMNSIGQPPLPWLFADVCMGDFDVQILLNNASCTTTSVNVPGFPALGADFNIPSIVCVVDEGTGMVNNIQGGLAPYVIDWYYYHEVGGMFITTYVTSSMQGEWVTGLPTGHESWVTVTDANGCHLTQKFLFSVPKEPVPNIVGEDPTPGQCNGEAMITFTGSAAVTSVAWFNTDGWTSIGSGNMVNSLCAGTYAAIYAYGGVCSDTAIVILGGASEVQINVRVLLEGPYVQSTLLMKDDLRTISTSPSFPLTEPYAAIGFSMIGSGGETIQPNVLTTTGPNAIVDWIFIELRSDLNNASVVRTIIGLLQRDGDVVGLDGVSPLTISSAPVDRYVAVRHRTHLGAMTLQPVAISSTSPLVDFTDAATLTYGANAQKTIGTKLVLLSGNALSDDRLQYTGSGNDRDRILLRIGGVVPTNVVSGYWQEDVNLDGLVKYTGSGNDRDLILVNIGGVVPTNITLQQLP